MAKQTINIGQTANDRSGDPLRTAFSKVNDNFTELYALISGSGGVDLTEMVQDYAATMFTSGTHSGITVTYDDPGNKMNLHVYIDGGDASSIY
jgi:hypothetical protein